MLWSVTFSSIKCVFSLQHIGRKKETLEIIALEQRSSSLAVHSTKPAFRNTDAVPTLDGLNDHRWGQSLGIGIS